MTHNFDVVAMHTVDKSEEYWSRITIRTAGSKLGSKRFWPCSVEGYPGLCGSCDATKI